MHWLHLREGSASLRRLALSYSPMEVLMPNSFMTVQSCCICPNPTENDGASDAIKMQMLHQVVCASRFIVDVCFELFPEWWNVVEGVKDRVFL